MAKKNGTNGKHVDLRTLPKAKRPKPSTGQSADERDLPFEGLNDDEKDVVKLLNGRRGGIRQVRSVAFLAEGIDGDNPQLQARNALRRLVSCGWAERVGRGQYKVSERGRKRLERA